MALKCENSIRQYPEKRTTKSYVDPTAEYNNPSASIFQYYMFSRNWTLLKKKLRMVFDFRNSSFSLRK